MAGGIGTAFVDVAFDPKQVGAQLSGLGSGLTGRLGGIGKVGGAALGVGIVAGAAVAGKKLFDLGAEFDKVEDTIRVGTGATGEALEGLVESAQGIATEIPTSFGAAADAVSFLNTRLGLTGEPLEGLASQFLELSRITGEDLPALLESGTRAFGDWGLAGQEAADGLDHLFRVSQATGAPVDRLQQLLVKFGSPLRQLGFGFEESAALMGKWEAEGVNTELVAGSMRIALGKFARAGEKDVPAAMRSAISAIADAGSAGEANALALETFGARAGPDMAAAIREGRFEVDDLLQTLGKSGETIRGAAEDTNSFGESWQMFKNEVAVALAPIAIALFDGLSDGAARALEASRPLIASLSTSLGPALRDIGQIVRDLEPVWRLVFATIGVVIRTAAAQIRAIVQVVRGVVQLVSALLRGDWSAAWQAVRTIVAGVVAYVRATLSGMLAHLRNIIPLAAAAAKGIARAILEGVTALAKLGPDLRGKVADAISAAASAAVGLAASIGSRIIEGILSGLGGLVSALRQKVESGIRGALDAVNPFSPIEVGAARLLGEPIAAGMLEGFDRGARPLRGRIEGAIVDAVRSARVVSPTVPLGFAGATAAAASSSRPGARAELTITNWRDGRGFVRWVADAAVADRVALDDQLARMGAGYAY